MSLCPICVPWGFLWGSLSSSVWAINTHLGSLSSSVCVTEFKCESHCVLFVSLSSLCEGHWSPTWGQWDPCVGVTELHCDSVIVTNFPPCEGHRAPLWRSLSSTPLWGSQNSLTEGHWVFCMRSFRSCMSFIETPVRVTSSPLRATEHCWVTKLPILMSLSSFEGHWGPQWTVPRWGSLNSPVR